MTVPTPIIDPLVVIPATSFYAPYWMLDLMLLGAVIIGLAIGLLAAWGPAKLRNKLWRAIQYIQTQTI